MGLDMYLEKRKKNSNEWEEVMYWRKANQIQNWFANNLEGGVENCEHSYVTIDNLIDLVDVCNEVIKDHSKADKLLPTCIGFFFGSTDYDQWYFDDLKETVEGVEKVIKETDWDNEEVAYFEWW